MNKALKQVLLAAGLSLLAAGASAVEIADREVGVMLGGGWGDGDLTGSDDGFGDVNPLIGLRYGKRLGTSTNLFGDLTYGMYDGNRPGVGDSDIFTARGGLEWMFSQQPKYNWFLSGALGAINVNTDTAGGPDFTRPLVSMGLGQIWGVGVNDSIRWEVRVDEAWGNSTLPGSSLTNFQALLGYSWGLGKPADADGDGVPNRHDQCPNTPMGAKVDAKGCPIDSDGDGVYDGLDQCPGTPTGVKVDSKGCPLDSDGDGVTDNLDQCPNTPAGVAVDSKGCPLDTDGDGVTDNLDQCPNTPAGVTVDSKGCPLDTDGDGVTDNLDQCPGTPSGVIVDAQGCPPVAENVTVVEEVIVKKLVLQGINFDSESDKITTQFDPVLENAAAALNNPAWQGVNVEVAGHTDYLGTDEYNLNLSERRANAVRDYLVSKGIAADRLTTKGYGKANPIADNATPEGRYQNRRVELVPMK